jgi:hypothetical protein
MKKRIIFSIIICLSCFLITAAVDPRNVITVTDQVLYEAYSTNQAISVGANYDSGYDDINFTVTNGSSRTITMPGTNYLIRSVTINNTSAYYMRVYLTGTGINGYDGSNTMTTYIPPSRSMTWEFSHLTGIEINNNAGANVTGDVFIRTTKKR